MINVQLRPCRDGDEESIGSRMRDADRAEIWASSQLEPIKALQLSRRFSEDVWTCTVDGIPEVMLGVLRTSHLPERGSPWLLGTDAVTKYPRQLLASGYHLVPQLLSKYKVLRNAVDDRNDASKRFLIRLGFRLGEPYPVFPSGVLFRPFEMRLEDDYV